MSAVNQSKLGFWTPIEYFNITTQNRLSLTLEQRIIANIEGYFAPTSGLRGCVAIEDKKKSAFLLYRETPLWKTALKVCSYLTLVIPALVLIAKIIIRRKLDVKLQNRLQRYLVAPTLRELRLDATCKNVRDMIEPVLASYYPESVTMDMAFSEILYRINNAQAKPHSPTSPLTIQINTFPHCSQESGRNGVLGICSMLSVKTNKFSVIDEDWTTAIFYALQNKKYIKIVHDQIDKIQLIVKRGYTLW